LISSILNLIFLDIHNKTIHFVERSEPIPPPGPNSASGVASNGTGSSNDGGINQATMDEVNETTSIFINAFPGAANLQPNDIQVSQIFIFIFDVQNLLNDLGDVGRQAQVNTTMAVREEDKFNDYFILCFVLYLVGWPWCGY
jgi:hypothetical protein